MRDPLKDKLREGIALENENLRLAIEAGEYSSPVYRARPGIAPVKGSAAAVKVDPNGLSRRRGAPRLGELVALTHTSKEEG